ncbi:UDP-glucose 4-epimerase GalE [Ornithinibacillus sp. BX22]|uniref:UDP-glucose 4-epimerase n=2 Tax=Ornithinibacillus TaxID=484508 RepID=A0A923RJG8_9BACI|nr:MULTISPECIES: UDP-glucose 4-epimerase GalE [Ornithinibacillus]MBC5637999.1 UDP-glucose 4-epimerase GalE [Ornithinibacillus hominis]MBS3681887.1 UDP-glucose 4-epimerase GalE [Ornithinibacillus massiliensis]
MAILVTGGAGYIGTHLCVELLYAGYDVVVIDNFSNSNPEALRRVKRMTGKLLKIYKLDLMDKNRLAQVFSMERIDAVIHLAGYKSVSESTSTPLKYYANNIAGTINLCEVMQRNQIKRLVFSSSATVYAPTAQQAPITEEHPVGASNPYGYTKQMIEGILHGIAQSDPSWSIRVLRYFNPVGAHESGRIGEDPLGVPNNLVPYIANVAVGNLPTLFIYGNDYPTKDGTGVRDYIHVVDLAKGHLHALKKVMESIGFDTYNLGTGKGYSVLEMVKAFEEVSNKIIPYKVVSRRIGDVAICYADVSKAREKLGWEAKRDIMAMCRDTWRWKKRNPNGYGIGDSKADEKEVMVHDW